MSARRSKGSAGVAVVVLALAYGLGVSCNGFREDEIECEKAVVRLIDCCPGFRAIEVDCNYRENIDCNDKVTGRNFPALSSSDSACIQSRSCADLVAKGDCMRAQVAKRSTVEVDAGQSSSKTPVCKL